LTAFPLQSLFFRGVGELQKQGALARVRLRRRDLVIKPGRLFLVIPAIERHPTHTPPVGGRMPGSTLVFFLFLIEVVVIIVVVIIVIIVEVVVVLVFVLVVILIVFGLGPALGLIRMLEIHFVPCLEVDFLDITVEILDLDQLGVLIDGQHAE
jgi:hypothetical protein